jgi:hypothetical protein
MASLLPRAFLAVGNNTRGYRNEILGNRSLFLTSGWVVPYLDHTPYIVDGNLECRTDCVSHELKRLHKLAQHGGKDPSCRQCLQRTAFCIIIEDVDMLSLAGEQINTAVQ